MELNVAEAHNIAEKKEVQKHIISFHWVALNGVLMELSAIRVISCGCAV